MYRWTTREELVLQVVTRAREGQKRRAIARALGISRNTARKILVAHALGLEKPHLALTPKPARAPRARPLDTHRTTIAKLIEDYPNITAQRIFEELREKGFSGGYTAVKNYVRNLRPAPKPEPSLTTPIYDAGEMAESDWATRMIRFENGERKKLQFFGYILTHSTRKEFLRARPLGPAHAHGSARRHLRSLRRAGEDVQVRLPKGRRAPLGRPAASL